MHTILIRLFLCVAVIAAPFVCEVKAAESFGIAATVNKDAISESDLTNRMRLMMASSGLPNTAANRDRLRSQALNSLIEEQIKIQEAARQNLQVTQEEIDNGFQSLADQNRMTSEQFAGVLQQQGIPKQTLVNQIKSQISWSKIITQVLRPDIDVSENDVTARLDRIKENSGQLEYLTSEIFLPVSDGAEEEKTKQLAEKLIEEIKSGKAPFDVVATQFSKADGAAEEGGSLGWVQAGQLPKELDVVVKSLNEGQISPPIRGLSGFHILKVAEKRTISGETLPTQDEVFSAIGLERLDRLQQRHLADLKSAALIDRRI